ncbi:hypothetical protein CBR_g25919 [Chara braunii]|uniref:Uncharacterized protein n=1 Tax=Chara braunii TaxID=69332 RepID=A0A388L6R2_CHABU|nr:hypothetical protein CBR_g25919 [Chara braunii]|eukprot:GBG77986.1 hypothetical protein CBR_g25919 [Chara braunii]
MPGKFVFAPIIGCECALRGVGKTIEEVSSTKLTTTSSLRQKERSVLFIPGVWQDTPVREELVAAIGKPTVDSEVSLENGEGQGTRDESVGDEGMQGTPQKGRGDRQDATVGSSKKLKTKAPKSVGEKRKRTEGEQDRPGTKRPAQKQKQPSSERSSPRSSIDVDVGYFLEYKDGVRTKREFEIIPTHVIGLGEWEDLYYQRSLDPVLIEGNKEAMWLAFDNKEQSYELPTLKLAPLGLGKPTPGAKAVRLKPGDWKEETASQYYYYAVCEKHNAAAARSLLDNEMAKKYNFEWWPTRMLWNYYQFKYEKRPDADWIQKYPFLKTKSAIFKEFESQGLYGDLWDGSRKYVSDSVLFKDCLPYMGCDKEQWIEATKNLVGHRKLSVGWRNKVLSVLTGGRMKSREITLAEGIVHIKWKDTGDVTSITPFDNDPLEADIRRAKLKEAVVATKSHMFVLDLYKLVNLKLWKPQAFETLNSHLQTWCSFDEASLAMNPSKASRRISIEHVIDGILDDQHVSTHPSTTPNVDDPCNIKPSVAVAFAFSPPNSSILPATLASGGEGEVGGRQHVTSQNKSRVDTQALDMLALPTPTSLTKERRDKLAGKL